MYNTHESNNFKKQYKELQKKFPDHNGKLEGAWHNTTSGRYLSDAVFAANDGVITTFAVVAGVAGAGLAPTVVIVLGIANLLADAASMGLGNFLGKRSERRYITTQKKKEAWEIDHMPEQERAEIEKIFKAKGFEGEALQQVVATITSNKELWIETMLKEELHIVPDDDGSPAKHGTVTWGSFVIAGVLPLLPFMYPSIQGSGFQWSLVMTFVALFLVGAWRTKIDGSHWLKSGIEMMLVGGIAAGIAYGVGLLLANSIHMM